MRFSPRRTFALALPLLVGAALVGCEQLPDEPATADAPDAEASHGASNIPSTTVELKEINGSGITGEVTLTDDGSEITVTGTAEGMDPAKDFQYLSLFYDKASPPNGPEACEPGTHDPNHPLFLTDAQMLGAIWTVDGNGDGTAIDLDEDRVTIDEIGTMSIRDLTVNDGFGPEAVVACGKVTHPPANGR